MGIRWDAVVDPAMVDTGKEPAPRFVVNRDSNRIEVEVRLFGVLASLGAERSIVLELPVHATVADLFAHLGERFGESFLALLLDEAGMKRRHCRLFIGGYPVENMNAALAATADPIKIEIILLVAPEGG